MSIRFTRLKVGYPVDYKHPEDHENSWRVYTVCQTEDPRSCTTRRDVAALGSVADRKDARDTYVTLLNKAQTGEPLSQLYDKTACHEAHEFVYTHASGQCQGHKIFRVRGPGAIRVYFMYLPGQKIVVLKTSTKRVDKLSAGEKSELKDAAEAVLALVDKKTFEECEI